MVENGVKVVRFHGLKRLQVLDLKSVVQPNVFERQFLLLSMCKVKKKNEQKVPISHKGLVFLIKVGQVYGKYIKLILKYISFSILAFEFLLVWIPTR